MSELVPHTHQHQSSASHRPTSPIAREELHTHKRQNSGRLQSLSSGGREEAYVQETDQFAYKEELISTTLISDFALESTSSQWASEAIDRALSPGRTSKADVSEESMRSHWASDAARRALSPGRSQVVSASSAEQPRSGSWIAGRLARMLEDEQGVDPEESNSAILRGARMRLGISETSTNVGRQSGFEAPRRGPAGSEDAFKISRRSAPVEEPQWCPPADPYRGIISEGTSRFSEGTSRSQRHRTKTNGTAPGSHESLGWDPSVKALHCTCGFTCGTDSAMRKHCERENGILM